MDNVTTINEKSVPGEILNQIEAILKEHEARLMVKNGRLELEYADATYWIRDSGNNKAVAELPRIFKIQRLVTASY